jgi:hypothetical protein
MKNIILALHIQNQDAVKSQSSLNMTNNFNSSEFYQAKDGKR